MTIKRVYMNVEEASAGHWPRTSDETLHIYPFLIVRICAIQRNSRVNCAYDYKPSPKFFLTLFIVFCAIASALTAPSARISRSS